MSIICPSDFYKWLQVFNVQIGAPGGGPVTAIAGSPNQIIASAPTGAVTLSFPSYIKIVSGIIDVNLNTILNFAAVASAVNYLQFSNAAAGGTPYIGGFGSDTNVSVGFQTKGNAPFIFTPSTAGSAAAKIRLYNVLSGVLGGYVGISAPPSAITSYDVFMPTSQGAPGTIPQNDGTGQLTWVPNPDTSGVWVDQTTTPVTLVNGNNYVADTTALTVFHLPSTVAFGWTARIIGKGSGGWILNVNAGQTAAVGNQTASTSVASQNQFDRIEVNCITANTQFSIAVNQGNVTVI